MIERADIIAEAVDLLAGAYHDRVSSSAVLGQVAHDYHVNFTRAEEASIRAQANARYLEELRELDARDRAAGVEPPPHMHSDERRRAFADLESGD